MYSSCVTARTLVCKVAFWQRTMASLLASSSKILNSRNIERIGLGCIQNLHSLFIFNIFAAQTGKVRTERIESFMNFAYYFNFFWTREQAQSQVCKYTERTANVINRHYRLVSPSTKQMLPNEDSKRKSRVNQSHASVSNNLNGSEEVSSNQLLPSYVE